MYYICKFSESWVIYEMSKNSSRPLSKEEVECVKVLFPALLADNNKILTAIQVSLIQPSKLLSLQKSEKGTPDKKISEQIIKS